MAPHTPNPWGHVELVQKSRGLDSGYWVRQGSAKSRDGVLFGVRPPFWNLINTSLIPVEANERNGEFERDVVPQ